MDENITLPTTNDTDTAEVTTPTAAVETEAAASGSNPYIVDAKYRTVEVEYPDQKFKLEHGFVKAERRDIVKYYLAAPSVKANAKGEIKLLGQPSAPAAELHDATCGQLKRTTIGDNPKVREFTNAEIRNMRQSIKADGVLTYLGHYDVELSVDSGDMDDLLFDTESTQITATVKTRPSASGKVDQIFKIFINRPNDLDSERFANGASGTSLIDKNDPMLLEFLGEEALSEMTGGIDEGERVGFSKTTQYARAFFDIIEKNIVGAENVVFEGKPYDPARNNAFVAALDPALKLQLAAAYRNFI